MATASCKGRWLCPSCHSKKTIQFGEDVPNNILYPVPHRQFVFKVGDSPNTLRPCQDETALLTHA
jgi:hypothetical protein